MHEDQKVAGTHGALGIDAIRPRGVRNSCARVDHALDLICDHPRKMYRVVGRAEPVHGIKPIAFFGLVGRFNHRPKIDPSGHV